MPRSNSHSTGSGSCSEQDRSLQRCRDWNHRGTIEPASDGPQHCSASRLLLRIVKFVHAQIMGDHIHSGLAARTPNLHDNNNCVALFGTVLRMMKTWQTFGDTGPYENFDFLSNPLLHDIFQNFSLNLASHRKEACVNGLIIIIQILRWSLTYCCLLCLQSMFSN